MKFRFISRILSLVILSCNASAITFKDLNLISNNSILALSFSGGPIIENAGKTQTFYLSPSVINTYQNKKNSNVLGTGEFFIGIHQSISPQFDGQLGIEAAVANTAKLKGVIWDDASPIFDNKLYRYKIFHRRVSAKGKLFFKNIIDFTPWTAGSLGMSFNRAYKFNNTPLIFAALPDANFTEHTKIGLAYTLSAGIQKSINNNWQLGAGYEFADWGKSELGRSADQVMNTGLKLKHLYTNGLIFYITFLGIE